MCLSCLLLSFAFHSLVWPSRNGTIRKHVASLGSHYNVVCSIRVLAGAYVRNRKLGPLPSDLQS